MATQTETHQSGPRPTPPDRSLKRRGWYLAAMQMAALLVVTILLEMFDVDRRVAAHFYQSDGGWYMARVRLWRWLYIYGTIPGFILTLGALTVCVAGSWMRSLRAWRKPCLLVLLTTILAASFLVNGVLKQYWGRPRPDQIVEFGGNWVYRPIFPPGKPGKGASFPCGHCAMGFIFLAMVGFRRQNKALAASGIAAGVALGALLSVARIAQGAHFLSDTIWSFGIVTMTVTLLSAYLTPMGTDGRLAADRPMSRSKKFWIASAAIVAVLIMTGTFLTRRPYYSTKVCPLNLAPDLEAIFIRINADPERISIRYGDQSMGRLEVDAHGFGWHQVDYRVGFETRLQGRSLYVSADVRARSYFAELNNTITLTLPRNIEHKVAVMVNERLLDGHRP